MVLKMYCVEDKVAESFSPPFTAVNDAVATRSVLGQLRHNPNKEDYALYYVGDFNCDNCNIAPSKDKRELIIPNLPSEVK